MLKSLRIVIECKWYQTKYVCLYQKFDFFFFCLLLKMLSGQSLPTNTLIYYNKLWEPLLTSIVRLSLIISALEGFSIFYCYFLVKVLFPLFLSQFLVITNYSCNWNKNIITLDLTNLIQRVVSCVHIMLTKDEDHSILTMMLYAHRNYKIHIGYL